MTTDRLDWTIVEKSNVVATYKDGTTLVARNRTEINRMINMFDAGMDGDCIQACILIDRMIKGGQISDSGTLMKETVKFGLGYKAFDWLDRILQKHLKAA